jgi:ribosomal protein L2
VTNQRVLDPGNDQGKSEYSARRRNQDWHADYYRHGGGRGKLDSRDDPIAPWDPPIVNQPTSNAEREQMRKSEADGSPRPGP